MGSMGRNTAFVYLYRDADNYKKWGRVVFEGRPVPGHEEALREACRRREVFVAGQVGVPQVFLWAEEGAERTVADHGWHEFWGLEETGEPVDDEQKRSIGVFVEEFCREGESGWEIGGAERW